MFHEFLEQHRAEILRRSRHRLLEEVVLRPTEDDLASGLPLFLGQLIESLRRYNGSSPVGELEIGKDALQFGRKLSRLGFTVTQLVHGYGAVSEAATALAHACAAEIGPEEHEVLNAALDIAIAQAVNGYQRERDRGTTDRAPGDKGHHAHGLRTALAAACVSFRALKRTGARCDGRIGRRLERSLGRMRGLIDHALAEEGLRAQAELREETIPLIELVDQIVATAVLDADARRLTMAATIDPGVSLRGDRQLLLSALGNLLGDAIGAARAGGHVQIRGYIHHGMVVVEIRDDRPGLVRGAAEGRQTKAGDMAAEDGDTYPSLHVAREAISRYDGTVSVHEVSGDGRVVTVRIPRRDAHRSA